MKVGVLFSGGKDSVLALKKLMDKEKIKCLISLVSKNEESYMFHVPNIHLTKLQARAMGLPLIEKNTKGEKEKELEDLKEAIKEAKERFGIDAIGTGALKSSYQRKRIEGICEGLDLKCINPLWKMDQLKLLKELVEEEIEVIITGVFAEPFTKEWLGRKIDKECIKDLEELKKKYKINPAGEGGEIETTVLDAPFFKKRMKVKEFSINYSNYSGTMKIEKAFLVDK